MQRLTYLLAAALLNAAPAMAQAVDEIRVIGTFIPDEKRTKSDIASIIDSEAMSLAGDGDVAVALTRLPGLSADTSGRYIIVRGLNDRYTTTTFNGAKLPSPDPLKNAVPLDIFPSSIIGNVLVQKSYSAEYSAAFGGGLVDMRSKAMPDEPYFDMSLSLGHVGKSSGAGGLDSPGSGTDWLTRDDGFRANPIPQGVSGAALESYGDKIPGAWRVTPQDNPLDGGFSFEGGNLFDTALGQIGFVAALDYGAQYRNKNGAAYSYTSVGGAIVPRDVFSKAACAEIGISDPYCGQHATVYSTEMNLFASVDFEPSLSSSYNLTSAILRASDKKSEVKIGYTDSYADGVRQSFFDWVERELRVTILSGEQSLSLFETADADVTWYASVNSARRDVPLRKYYEEYYYADRDAFGLSLRLDSNDIAWNEMRDEGVSLGATLEQIEAVPWFDLTLKLGFAYDEIARHARQLQYGLRTAGLTEAQQFGDIDSVLQSGLALTEKSRKQDSFTADFSNLQFFLQGESQISDFTRLTLGSRFEQSEQEVDTFLPGTDTRLRVVRAAKHLLPAASLTWEFSENMQLRFGGSQTLNRPTSRELAPAQFIREDGRKEQGDADLRTAKLSNFDIRYEWYFDRLDSLTIGGFYKDIADPIEYSIQPIGGELKLDTMKNAEAAQLIGLEVAFDKALFTQGEREFFTKSNLSLISSSVERDRAVFGNITDIDSPLQGQSDILANVQFGYRHIGEPESLNLTINYVGARVYRLGTNGLPNLIEQPPLDISIIFRDVLFWGEQELTYSIKARNLLGERNERRYAAGVLEEEYESGAALSLGVTARF